MSSSPFTVALVGNPNTGKSTLFNALTGLRQHIGNYPGVTVDLKKGECHWKNVVLEVIDLPGTYSLAARSPDEMVTVDLLLGHRPEERRPDVILSIVDASNLERHLYLTSQLLELERPVVIAVNLIDIAEKQQIRLDYKQLSNQLGVPIVPIQANRGIGLEELKDTLIAAQSSQKPSIQVSFPKEIEEQERQLQSKLPQPLEPFLLRRLIFDVAGAVEEEVVQRYGASTRNTIHEVRQELINKGMAIPASEAKARYTWIRQIVSNSIHKPTVRPITWTQKLDRILIHRLWGTMLFLALMFLIFQSIFFWALPLMSLIDSGKEWVSEGITSAMDPGPLRSLLVDGILRGVGGVLVFLPQIMILFGFIAILEDCGYMARAAYLMDKIMSKCGLNGKSFIPLLSSVACAVPGIMATRVIENTRDRLATIVVAPLMSCSARLPLYILLIGVFLSSPAWLPGLVLFGLYLLGMIVAPLVALTLKKTLLKGRTPPFIMELPSLKRPSLLAVFRRMIYAGWAFVYRAGTLILASMVLVWALLYFPTTDNDGTSYLERTEQLQTKIDELTTQVEQDESLQPKLEKKEQEFNQLYGEWKRQSYLGRAGRLLEPAFEPLGWDWKMGMAALASFPAREVVVGVLGIIYNQGDVDPKSVKEADDPSDTPLGKAIQQEWSSQTNRSKYAIPAALSLLVFFALCCQCVSTLAVIRRETKSWKWPIFTFVYMTTLAYFGAMITFQIGKWFVG